MEIRKNTRSTVTNTEGKQFTIKASAKAFRILSDGLYSDKITAIIRELSTNAYDAQVAAGNADQSFQVHLPVAYPQDECYFSIRDFGNSMTHDQVMELYATYFGSDKTESNEFVGALGLGSKSPFSYTDSFTITAILNGDMRHYVSFMDKDGTPTISLLSQSETSEPNGVEVKFTVNEENCDNFRDKARNVYRFFPVKPEINGNSTFEHYNDRSYIESNDWTLIRGDRYYTSCYAIQGNIAYKIDPTYITNVNAAFVANNNFHVQFDIGDLDVSASRESLSYDKLTIENIEKRFSKVHDEFVNKVNEIISVEKSEWHAKLKAQEIISGLNNPRHANKIELTYNGKILNNLQSYEIAFDDFPNVKIIHYWYHSTYRADYVKRGEITKKSDSWGEYNSFTFPVENNVVFVEDDGSKLKVPRVRHHSETHKKHVYLVEGATRKFWSAVGKPDKVKLSKLDTPPRKKTVQTEGGKYYFLYDNGFNLESGIGREELPKGNKYYVEIKSNNIIKYNQKIAINAFIKDIQMATELGLIDSDIQIFGVASRETKTKRFEKSGMIHLFNHLHLQVVDKVSEMKDDLDEYFKVQVKNNSLGNMSRLSRDLLKNRNILNLVSKNSRVFEIQTQILEIENDWNNLDIAESEIKMLIEMAQRHKVEIIRPEFEYKVDSLEAYYPMLQMINHYSYDFVKVIEYINLVDKSKS